MQVECCQHALRVQGILYKNIKKVVCPLSQIAVITVTFHELGNSTQKKMMSLQQNDATLCNFKHEQHYKNRA